MSSRHLQDVLSVTIFRLQDVLRDVFKTSLQDVFKTSRKTKNCYADDVLKTSSRRLEDQPVFAGWLIEISYQELGIKGKARNPGIVAKLSILDVDEGSGYAFEIQNST